MSDPHRDRSPAPDDGPTAPADAIPDAIREVLAPWDVHNRALATRVHPREWTNPTPAGRYHLVVVGAGTGGLVSAAIAASLGARVALVERALMGGDCLNVGCVPSKALLAAARGWRDASAASDRFGGPPTDGDGDFAAVMRRMRRLRAEISPADGAERFRSMGVDVFFGVGRFTAPDTLLVDGDHLAFRRAIVATGARPAVPPIDGLREAGFLTNETVFSLTERPHRLVVIGAGPIGCELAQAFARFGVDVALVDMAPRPLPREESDASAVVQRALERDGVRFIGEATVAGVDRSGPDRVVTVERRGDRHELRGSHVLLAAGRSPNVDGLGLDAAGVDHDAHSGVHVDRRLRTTNRRIYAVGDVASPALRFTHAADAQARLAVRNALFFGRGDANELVIPWCTYTSPELARVGRTAEEAADADIAVDSITIPFQDVDRARLEGGADGFVRIHVREGSDRIVGGTIVGEHAGDLIGQLAHAMKEGAGLQTLGDVVYPYPTRAEALRKAADAFRRRRLTPRVRRAFEVFFRLFG